MNTQEAVNAVRAVLGPHLLEETYLVQLAASGIQRPLNAPDSWMLCYAASEAVKNLANERLKSCSVRIGAVVHWFLRDRDDRVVDPTADQFNELPDYDAGRGRGFRTRRPSRHAQRILDAVKASR